MKSIAKVLLGAVCAALGTWLVVDGIVWVVMSEMVIGFILVIFAYIWSWFMARK